MSYNIFLMSKKLLLFLIIWLKRHFKKESVLILVLDLSDFMDVIVLISIFLILWKYEYEFLVGLCKLMIYEDDKILGFKNEILLVIKIK